MTQAGKSIRLYRDPAPNRAITATILIGAIALFGLVGAMDYADEQRAHQHYCDMVAIDAWPDRPELDCDGRGRGFRE